MTLFDLDTIYVFGLLLARAGGFVASAPFLGEAIVPRKIKVLLTGTLALVMLPLVTATVVRPPHFAELVISAAGEILLGLAMGFLGRLLLLSFEMAGEVISYQMGFAMASVADPLGGHRHTVMARWLWLTGLTMFLTLGGHHHMLRALRLSLDQLPPGHGMLGPGVVEAMSRFTADTFGTALSIAAPAIGVLLLTTTALGILARTVPQMNVFIVGFPLKISAGIAGVIWALPYLVEVARREIGELAHHLSLLAAAA